MLKRLSISVVIVAMVAGGCVRAADDVSKGNIHPNFKVSFTERFRFVSWDNYPFPSDFYASEAAFTRHRTSVMGRWFPNERLELGLKLTNEFRFYFVPRSNETNIDEVFVDLLYARWNYGRFNLILGRQNLMLGEGFLVMDGGPLDGSRSAYFNAARLDVKPCSEGTLSLFYFYQPVYDEYLPLINDREKAMVENDEQGFGGYVSRNFGKSNVQAYYIRKNVIDTITSEVESGINTVGARLTLPLNDQWSITAEGAYQFGTFGDVNRKAYGGYGYVDYTTNWPEYLPAKLTAGAVYLSGDDIGTEDYEGWDPLFGRWPKWSESYIYTLILESGVAGWSNYASLYGKAKFVITKDISFVGQYLHLWAPGHSTGLDFWELQGEGTNRGDMIIGKLAINVNDYLSSHVLWEYFRPGDYYSDYRSEANWLRFELMLKVE